jgi:hypothetical protein
MKTESARLTNPFLHYGILFLIYGVGLVTLLSHGISHAAHSHGNDAKDTSQSVFTAPCPSNASQSFKLKFTRRGAVPAEISAHRCDSITVINDTPEYLIAAFGPHEHHQHYPGFEERKLSKGQSYSFRLAESGTFTLHDHDNQGLRAILRVSE